MESASPIYQTRQVRVYDAPRIDVSAAQVRRECRSVESNEAKFCVRQPTILDRCAAEVCDVEVRDDEVAGYLCAVEACVSPIRPLSSDVCEVAFGEIAIDKTPLMESRPVERCVREIETLAAPFTVRECCARQVRNNIRVDQSWLAATDSIHRGQRRGGECAQRSP